MADHPTYPRTVRPRRKGNANMPLIVLHRFGVFIERTGEHFPLDQLPAVVAAEPSSIFVAHNFNGYFWQAHEAFKDNPRWQFRMTPLERDHWTPNREQIRKVRETIVGFFGFRDKEEYTTKSGERKHRYKTHYHFPLDPITFVRKNAFEIRGRDSEPELVKLFQWAKEVREFLVANDFRLTSTSGGIANQLLKDERFYPEARRKVPKATNARARDQLPGNFYRLYSAVEGEFYNATYLDQVNAHHSIARELPFPSSNRLTAKGFFRAMARDINKPWARSGSELFDKVLAEHGLFYICLTVPVEATLNFPPPYMETAGEHFCFVFSNELDDIRVLGARIEYVVAAWTSPERDLGLAKYAEWAMKEIAQSDRLRRAWLKPLLLSTYGVLAARPRHLEFGFWDAESGEKKRYPVGPEMVEVFARRTSKENELAIANVIQRGMIEAETRARSLRLARELQTTGMRVLAVYADSVFVESGQLPLLPKGWKIERELTALRFFNATSFTSKEIEKLPGITAEQRKRLSEITALELRREIRSKRAATRQRKKIA